MYWLLFNIFISLQGINVYTTIFSAEKNEWKKSKNWKVVTYIPLCAVMTIPFIRFEDFHGLHLPLKGLQWTLSSLYHHCHLVHNIFFFFCRIKYSSFRPPLPKNVFPSRKVDLKNFLILWQNFFSYFSRRNSLNPQKNVMHVTSE